MDRFTEKILNFMRKNDMAPEGTTVVVGFSGGADSTALMSVLDDLKRILKINIVAVHVNHGIRPEAVEDERFAKDFCMLRGIPIRTFFFDIPKISRQLGLTEEEAGRKARYEAFGEVAGQCEKYRVAVAHHQNDVAETLLMNLSRGSGLKGGSSIRAVRDEIIRPLLCVSRREIEDYLARKGLSYCTDATNFENDHTRNIIRNLILPELEKDVNSRAPQHIARAAATFEKAEEFIRSFSDKVYDRIVTKGPDGLSLNADELKKEVEIVQENVILRCFEELVPSRKDITFLHVDAVLGLLGSKAGTASADLPYGLKAVRSYGILHIGKSGNEVTKYPQISMEIKEGKETVIDIPGLGRALMAVIPMDKKKDVPRDTYTKWFDYDRIQTAVFRHRQAGDVISIELNGILVRKQLSKYMTDEKIPKFKRDELYLLADGSEILWIPGYRMSAAYKVSEDTRKVLSVKILNGGNF